MAKNAKFLNTLLACILITSAAYAEPLLTVERAIETALAHDALIQVYQSQRDAYKEQSVAEDTLPDPKIKLGLMNVPTDTYKFNQEPMTQVQLGIQQMFPRGDSLEIKSQRATSQSNAQQAKVNNQKRTIKNDVRETWLEHFYWLNAEQVVIENKRLFNKLVSVTQQQYAAGRQEQQDVIRSELELGMLDDKELNIRTQLQITKAKLSKLIGQDISAFKLSTDIPEFNLNRKLSTNGHPMLHMENAKVSMNQNNVDLAKQSFKPSWMLDVTYGKRETSALGVERADFLSAMVVFDLPLFTADKQDKKVAASKYRLNSALNQQEERKRELNRMLQVNLEKEKNLSLRVTKYQQALVPKAKENTSAAMFAYQSGRGAFAALMRAQITELETQLSALRLTVEHKKSQAKLLYLAGEEK